MACPPCKAGYTSVVHKSRAELQLGDRGDIDHCDRAVHTSESRTIRAWGKPAGAKLIRDFLVFSGRYHHRESLPSNLEGVIIIWYKSQVSNEGRLKLEP